MPLADAGVGLPGAGIDLVEDAALVVDDAGGAVGAVGEGFAEVDGLGFAAVGVGAYVVESSDHGGEGCTPRGLDAAVGVEEVGLVLIEEVFDAVEVLELPPVGCDAAHGVVLDGLKEVGGHGGVVVIEVGEGGVLAVVGDVGVGTLGVGESGGGANQSKELERCSETPKRRPRARAAEAQRPTMSLCGPESNRVPARLVLGVPEIVAVVVNAHGEEVFRAGALVEIHQVVGVPLFGGEERDEVFVAGLGLGAEALEVVVVLRGAFDVHVAGVPVAVADGGLWTPVGPDAEFRVGEPVGRGVGAEGGAGVGEGAGGDGGGRGRGRLAGGLREGVAEGEGGGGGGEELQGLAAG